MAHGNKRGCDRVVAVFSGNRKCADQHGEHITHCGSQRVNHGRQARALERHISGWTEQGTGEQCHEGRRETNVEHHDKAQDPPRSRREDLQPFRSYCILEATHRAPPTIDRNSASRPVVSSLK